MWEGGRELQRWRGEPILAIEDTCCSYGLLIGLLCPAPFGTAVLKPNLVEKRVFSFKFSYHTHQAPNK